MTVSHANLPSRSLLFARFYEAHTARGARSDSMHFVSAFTTPSSGNSNGARQKREKNWWLAADKEDRRSQRSAVSRFQIRSLDHSPPRSRVRAFVSFSAATVLTFFFRRSAPLPFFPLSCSIFFFFPFSFFFFFFFVRHRRHAMRILLNQPERRYRRVARKSSSPKNRERQVD